MPTIKLQLKLKLVAEVDFRFGVLHHWKALKHRGVVAELDGDGCVLLVSKTRTRLAFLFPDADVHRTSKVLGEEKLHGIGSFQLALDRNRPWSPLMLQNYAEQAKIELVGLKRFEEHLAKLEKGK